jgi:hypothetical protein
MTPVKSVILIHLPNQLASTLALLAGSMCLASGSCDRIRLVSLRRMPPTKPVSHPVQHIGRSALDAAMDLSLISPLGCTRSQTRARTGTPRKRFFFVETQWQSDQRINRSHRRSAQKESKRDICADLVKQMRLDRPQTFHHSTA